MAYDDDHDRRVQTLKQLQAENDALETLPNDLALALAEKRVLMTLRVSKVKDLLARGMSHEDIVKHEEEYLDAKARNWDIDREAVSWIQCSVFMAEFSRWIRKRAADKHGGLDVGTAAACYNPKTEEVEIVYNPRFMASIAEDRQGNGVEPRGAGVNEHEHKHLIFQHVTARRREPHSLWNIATDLAINSLIARGDTPARLPAMLLLPGLMNKGPVDPKLPKEVKEAREKLNKIIASLPQEQASEWYFNKLKEESEKQGYTWGKQGMKVPGAANPDGEGNDEGWVLWPSDQHGGWDDIPEELRDIVEGKVKHALRKAAEKADNTPNGWGNIPSEVREEIRAYAFGSVDWKAVLRNFCGNLRTGERSRSIKRIDRRAPYVMPGLRRGRNPSVLVLVDQSGSVSDDVLSRFFGALDGLSRKMTFDVVPFDHTVAADCKFEWKRGTKPRLQRVRSGGTSFDAAIEYANDPRNRGKWEGVIMLTDGECSQPRACRNKLAYVIAPGHKLYFAPRENEIVIQMSEKERSEKGKW